MTLTFRNPVTMDARRERSLDRLASGDRLLIETASGIVRYCNKTEAYGPPAFISPTRAMLDYYSRKRAAIRAAYFRQRYGRDYWSGIPRHARAA